MNTTFVGVDPGYRNLGIVVVRMNNVTSAITLDKHYHIDIGRTPQEADIITKVWNVLDIEQPFAGADFVTIERQNFGRRNTQPVNQGLAWLLATTALNQSPRARIMFMGSLTKFSIFKEIQMPHKIKRVDKGRRVKIKANSIYLAVKLLQNAGISPCTLFHDDKDNQWEHLADAVNLAFASLKSL